MSMTRTPLSQCTYEQFQNRSGEWWSMSRAVYDESLVEIERLNQHHPHRVVLHQHRHGQPCNDDCIMLEPSEQEHSEPGEQEEHDTEDETA